MNNRLLEYDVPTEEELVSRLLSSLHKTLDEQFPTSHRGGDGSRRFARTEFSSVSEDTIIEQTPGPAMGEPINEGNIPTFVPPPPRAFDAQANIPLPRPQPPGKTPGTIAPSSQSSNSLPLPSALSNASKPLSRTKVASNVTSTNFQSDAIPRKSPTAFSLKLFAFMFAILLGIAIGSIVFLFWVR